MTTRIDPDAAIVRKLTLAADMLDPYPTHPESTVREVEVTVPAYILAEIMRNAAGMYAAVSELFPGEADDRAQAATCDPDIQLADYLLDRLVGR